MLKNQDLKSVVDTAVAEAGGNCKLGYNVAANKIASLIEEKKLKPEDFSVREMYRTLVDPNMELQIASAQAVTEAIQSSAFPNITTKVMTAAVIPAFELATTNVDMLISEDNAYHTGTNDVPGFSAADVPRRRNEGFPYKETGLGEKYVSIDTADIGQIIDITRETIFNDRTGQLLNRARNIGEYLGQVKERQVIQTIEIIARTDLEESSVRAFVSMGTAITQSNFYSNDHSAVSGLDGQVNDNIDVTDVSKLSTDGLDNTAGLFDNFLDEKSNKIAITPKVLLIPGKFKRKAWQLVNGDAEFDTANRADNYFKGLYQVVSSPFLATSYYYYLGDFAKQLLWLWVWKPETEVQGAGNDLAFSNQIVMRMRTSMYGGVGHTDYRYIVRGGSTA